MYIYVHVLCIYTYILSQMSTVFKALGFVYTELVDQSAAHFCGQIASASRRPGMLQVLIYLVQSLIVPSWSYLWFKGLIISIKMGEGGQKVQTSGCKITPKDVTGSMVTVVSNESEKKC